MKKALLVLCVGIAFVCGVCVESARADSFTVIGLIQAGFSGPAIGATVTFCEYGQSNGFIATQIVPESGFVTVIFPYLPRAVMFEVDGDPIFEDVHIVVGQPICPVSPCQPDQSAAFEVRLARRPPDRWRRERFEGTALER